MTQSSHKSSVYRSNIGNFQQFSHHNFRLKWKFWILMVSSERSSSDLSEYTLFQIKNMWKSIFRWKNGNVYVFYSCFQIISKYQRFYKFWWLYRKNYIKIYQAVSSFYAETDLNSIKKYGSFLMNKWETQVIISIIVLTRSSERIFNPSRYTCCIYDYAHSFFGEEFQSNALYWFHSFAYLNFLSF